MGGRCIVRNCAVACMASTLASTSPCSAALKRGPSDILFACTQILSNKSAIRSRHVGLTITRQRIRIFLVKLAKTKKSTKHEGHLYSNKQLETN